MKSDITKRKRRAYCNTLILITLEAERNCVGIRDTEEKTDRSYSADALIRLLQKSTASKNLLYLVPHLRQIKLIFISLLRLY